MKYILFLLLFIISSACFSQATTTFYFDRNMNVVQQRDAFISGTGEWKDSLYAVTCHYIKSHKPAGIFHYTDATLNKRQGQCEFDGENEGIQTKGIYSNGDRDGLWLTRYGDGRLDDSTMFDKGAAITSVRYYYYPDNHLQLVMEDDVIDQKFYALGYTKGASYFRLTVLRKIIPMYPSQKTRLHSFRVVLQVGCITYQDKYRHMQTTLPIKIMAPCCYDFL